MAQEISQNEKDLSQQAVGKDASLSPSHFEAIVRRCRALEKSEQLDAAEKMKILRTVSRLIVQTREQELFQRITGMSPGEFLVKIQTGGTPINLSDILADFNEKLGNPEAEVPVTSEELLRIQRLKASFGDILVDKVNLAETRKQALAMRAELDEIHASEEIRTQIDNIIDEERGKPLDHVLGAIAEHLRDALGPETIQRVSISYVNDENDYLEHQHLNRVTPNNSKGTRTEATTNADYPPQIFSSKKNTSLHDKEKNTFYVSLKLGKQCLGIIEITFKNQEQRLTKQQEDLCHKAITVIDTFLDTSLKKQRTKKHRRKIARILDRSGTDIVFEEGKEKGFRVGLLNALSYLCKKTGAKYIMLDLDVTGDKTSFPLQLLASGNGEENVRDRNAEIGTLEARSRDITIPVGGKIDDQTPTQVDGKIIFFGEDLDDEEQDALELAAEQIITTVRSWRVDLKNTVQYGVPPQVGLLLKKGLLKTRSVEDVSMGFTDIFGFTAISEKFREITRKYHLKEDYMIRLMGAFDRMGKEIAKKSGGCYDKLVGDCLIISNGPPYTTDGKDSLGMEEHEPMYHAMNSLKMALRIRKALPEVEHVFENLLSEMSEEIEKNVKLGEKAKRAREKARQGKSAEEIKDMRLQDFCRTHKLYPRLKVTQGISSGEVTVGLISDDQANGEQHSTSYTIIGDEMNLAARLQSNATPHEIIISKQTKELLERGICGNVAVPFDENGSSQTWEEFKAEILGAEFETFDLLPVFEKTMLHLKNKAGYEFAYRLSFEKIRRIPVDIPETLTEAELRKMSGSFKVTNRDPKGKLMQVQLENLFQADQKFSATIKKPKEETRYVPPEDYDNRVKNDSETVLQIQNGQFTLIEYQSIERLINPKLAELSEQEDVYEPDEIPHGIYTVKERFESSSDDNDEIILKVEMNGKTLFIKVHEENLLSLRDLEDKPKAKAIFDIHRYLFDKRKSEAASQLQGFNQQQDQNKRNDILFIHSSGEFIGKIENH